MSIKKIVVVKDVIIQKVIDIQSQLHNEKNEKNQFNLIPCKNPCPYLFQKYWQVTLSIHYSTQLLLSKI